MVTKQQSFGGTEILAAANFYFFSFFFCSLGDCCWYYDSCCCSSYSTVNGIVVDSHTNGMDVLPLTSLMFFSSYCCSFGSRSRVAKCRFSAQKKACFRHSIFIRVFYFPGLCISKRLIQNHFGSLEDKFYRQNLIFFV